MTAMGRSAFIRDGRKDTVPEAFAQIMTDVRPQTLAKLKDLCEAS